MITESPPTLIHPLSPESRCSVIIVGYNHRTDLLRCLASLRGSTAAEIILVDNGSSDGTAEAISALFPEVHLVRSCENLGFGRACNLGARLANGHALAFLNPDTLVTPGWLEALVQALNRDPKAGLATSKVLLLHDRERINTCGNDVHLTGLTLCRGLGSPWDSLTDASEVAAVSGAAFAIHRELFWRLGGFDPTFFLYLEDTDLSLRARLAGYHCVYVPDSIVYHHYRLRFAPLKIYFQERNRYLILLKTYCWRTLCLLIPVLLLAELITWGFVLLWHRRRWRDKASAYLWIARHGRDVLAQRRATQVLRRVGDGALLAQAVGRLDYYQTGQGLAPRLARIVFDPFFLLWRRLAIKVLVRP
jgi:GT2 family glycosyltransferase